LASLNFNRFDWSHVMTHISVVDQTPASIAPCRPLSESSSEFVARLKSQDPEALAELYDRYKRQVFSLVLRIVERPAIAEDLVQESFLRLWRNAHHLNDECQSAGPWLMTIARNCALDYVKSARTMSSVPVESCALAASELESNALASERAMLVRKAFHQLPLEQKEAIELAFYRGFSQAAIAEKLRQPLGTIKGRVRLGLAKMRVTLQTPAVTMG
jgi:RNA polymerase sigma-70 factor, ECF subfamily